MLSVSANRRGRTNLTETAFPRVATAGSSISYARIYAKEHTRTETRSVQIPKKTKSPYQIGDVTEMVGV